MCIYICLHTSRRGRKDVCWLRKGLLRGSTGGPSTKGCDGQSQAAAQDSCVGGTRVSPSSTQQLPLPKQSPLTTPQSIHMSPLFQLCPPLILCTATLGGF